MRSFAEHLFAFNKFSETGAQLHDSVYHMTLKLHFMSDFYTPPHKKWWGIMLYPPNFECPSVRPFVVSPSIHPSALRFGALTSVPLDLFSSNFA